MRWQPIKLSRGQVKNADRVGGVDLILPWPEGLPLGDAPTGDPPERPTTPAEHAVAEQIVGAACREAGLVPGRSWVAVLYRHGGLPRPRETLQHLVVWICGHRWLHATGSPNAIEMWCSLPKIEREISRR